MTKTGLYLQDPKYQVRLGGKADFIADPSLVLYAPLYKLDGASFMSKDAYGHLCTRFGPLWTPGGRDFDGVDDYIEVPHHTSLNFERTAPFSLEFWLQTTFAGFAVLGKMMPTAPERGYDAYLLGDGRIRFHLNSHWADGNYLIKQTVQTVNDGTWKNIAIIYDGSSLAAGLQFYINGLFADDTTYMDALTATIQTTLPFTIGSRQLSSYFNGLIGEVRIYNRALTPQEIQHNYLATQWRYR